MTVLKTGTWLAVIARWFKRLAGWSLYFPAEAPHFEVQVAGDWYVFCATHKNVSSSIRADLQAFGHLFGRREEI